MSLQTKSSGLWIAGGLRSPFAKVDAELGSLDAIELSTPVVKAMLENNGNPIEADLAVWGTVAPNLGYSLLILDSFL